MNHPPRRPATQSFIGATLLCVALLSACGLLRQTTVPMRSLQDNAACSTRPDTLIVMLPGGASPPEEFLREGFVRTLRERRLGVDVVLVDAHPGYYRQKIILERLQADVIAPARAKGYRKIWLVGVSLGGFGALIQALTQPTDADGLMLLAPYLGERRVIDAVRADGGLQAWRGTAPAAADTADAAGTAEVDMDLRLWRWLQAYSNAPAQRPPLYLGYALSDRLAPSNSLLAASLPPERVFTVPGGHDWPEWRALWNHMLDRTGFVADASCTVATGSAR